MRLKEARVKLYRNIVDSGPVPIEDSVTCLVGKNESGKTAFLEALYSLNPVHPNLVRVNVINDYPRWRKVRDERERDLESIAPIGATFTLEDRELNQLRKLTAIPIPDDTEVYAERTYGGVVRWRLSMPELGLVQALLDSDLLDEVACGSASHVASLEELDEFTQQRLAAEDRRTKSGKDILEFRSLIKQAKALRDGSLTDEIKKALQRLLPTFFYFSEYSSLEGRIDLTDLLQKPEERLEDHEQTALSLLRLVGVEGQEFMQTEFEVRIAELEAAANEITRQIFDYWTQNTDLIVRLVGDAQTINRPDGQSVVHRYLDIRLNDLRHQMTTNFQTRSTGFQWFFSFIVAFSEFEGDRNVIILLDEPGLGLHARAQADLLRFIEERLASASQVIHTTHSPFMVNPRHLERARLVEDLTTRKNPDVGAKVSTDVLSVKRDTLFPLQAALGYDIAQNLFVGGHNLIVEGPSDLVFLIVLSEYLEERGLAHLDPRLTIVPVGGADKIPTFVALLGAHLDVSVLVDSLVTQNQRLQDMIDQGLLDAQRLISVGQVTQVPASNVEDVFTPGEYLRLYNEAYNESLKVAGLTGSDSIIQRIERHRSSQFNHLRPALALLGNRDTHLDRLSEGTIQRFEQLFQLVNDTLPE